MVRVRFDADWKGWPERQVCGRRRLFGARIDGGEAPRRLLLQGGGALAQRLVGWKSHIPIIPFLRTYQVFIDSIDGLSAY